MKKSSIVTLTILASSLLAPGLNAAVLANYNFDGVGNNSGGPFPVFSTDASITASDIQYVESTGSSTGITPQGTDRGDPAPALKDNFANNGFSSTTIENALSNDDYLGLTLTPSSGSGLSFQTGDTLTFDSQLFYAGSATVPATSTIYVSLFSSVDGFASSANQVGLTQEVVFENGVGGETSGFSNYSISLASLGSIGIDSPLELRLYVFRDAGTGTGTTNLSSRYVDFDNIVVNGAVIPEPSTVAFGVGALTVLLTMLIRRKKNQHNS